MHFMDHTAWFRSIRRLSRVSTKMEVRLPPHAQALQQAAALRVEKEALHRDERGRNSNPLSSRPDSYTLHLPDDPVIRRSQIWQVASMMPALMPLRQNSGQNSGGVLSRACY